MKKSLFKPVLGGVFLGSILFAMPFFILKVALFFLVCGTLMRLFARGRMRHGGMRGMGFGPAFADKIRGMSDEEYDAFKTKFEGRCGKRKRNPEADMI